MARSDMRFCT